MVKLFYTGHTTALHICGILLSLGPQGIAVDPLNQGEERIKCIDYNLIDKILLA